MIDKIKNILFDVRLSANKIENEIIFYNDFPEDSVSLSFADNKFVIEEIHRDNRIRLMETTSEYHAILYCVAILDQVFNTSRNIEITREIKAYIQEGNIIAVEQLLSEKLDSTLFSLGSVERDKLTLVKENNAYTLIFNDVQILTDLSSLRAYIVLFNYTKKLERAKELYARSLHDLPGGELKINQFVEYYLIGRS
ncbi:TPA: hypothetical protein TVN69_000856 [Streptococcus equi subsp. zooepidemicus]|nr:hypothetical protein [Streptococcus equi subsp. zooepidemicus]HEL1229700.1 hypothetical protein [Streptococcus equi subsp. zooepidemicus]